MIRKDDRYISQLLESNTSHLFLLCNDYSSVSDTDLEELIGSHIQENLRIIQKLKALQ